MAGADAYYPPSPAFVPKELTKPSWAYRWRLLLTLFALILFLVCYLGLMASALALGYFLWQWEVVDSDLPVRAIILKYASLAAVAMFFAFLVRGLFVSSADETEGAQMELTPEQAPRLFAFLDRLCDEVRARRPRRVYVTAGVKTCVTCDPGVLHLLIPPRWDLHIGLWLVNTLNLSEFKAVLAHELAHISQKATWLASYLGVAYRITRGMVHARGRLEEWLDSWTKQPLFVSLPAGGLQAFLFISRHLLKFAFAPLDRCYRSLRRAQELHADQIAASAAGSDAVVNGLYKLRFAAACYERTLDELDTAANRGLYTSDLFFHQAAVAAWLRKIENDPYLGIPPDPPKDSDRVVLIFDPTEEDFNPDPKSTHPTFYQRELNVKRCYLRCPIDERSAWVLFDQADQLRFEITRRVYEEQLKCTPVRMAHPDEVQRFMDGEFEDVYTLRRHRQIFSTRRAFPGDWYSLLQQPQPNEPDLSAFLASWPSQEAEAVATELFKMGSEYADLEAGVWLLLLNSAEGKKSEGKPQAEDGLSLLDQFDEQIAQLEQQLFPYQNRFLTVHLAAAQQLDRLKPPHNRAQWLLHYVAVHHDISRLYEDLLGLQKDLFRLVARIFRLAKQYEGTEPPQEEKDLIAEWCRRCVGQLRQVYERSRQLRLPPMTNVSNGTTCYELMARSMDHVLSALGAVSSQDYVDAAAVMTCAPEIPSVRADLGRTLLKCAAAIVRFCEHIAREWQDLKRAAPPVQHRAQSIQKQRDLETTPTSAEPHSPSSMHSSPSGTEHSHHQLRRWQRRRSLA